MVRPDQVRDFGLGAPQQRSRSVQRAEVPDTDESDSVAEFIEGEPQVNLNALTRKNLRAYAAQHGIDLGGATKKADIIKAIQEAT